MPVYPDKNWVSAKGGEGNCYREAITTFYHNAHIISKSICLKKKSWEFALWLGGLRTQYSIRKDAGSIPGLAQ